jgi:hypothetical protein
MASRAQKLPSPCGIDGDDVATPWQHWEKSLGLGKLFTCCAQACGPDHSYSSGVYVAGIRIFTGGDAFS